MSRFAVVYEDPTYEEPVMGVSWVDLLDGMIEAEKSPQPNLDEQLYFVD
jgi:hypothetical protein